MLQATQATEGPIEIGTKFHVRFKPFMGTSVCTMNVSAYETNRRQELEGSPVPAIKAHSTMTFETSGTTTVVVRHTRMEVGGWMWLMQPMMRRRLRRIDAGMLAKLKELLET